MKILSIFVISLLSLGAMASVHKDIHVELNFDESLIHEHDHKIDSQYLTIVPEKIFFPNGRQHRRLNEAIALIDQVVNSEEFKNKVISFTRKINSGIQENSYEKNYLWNDISKKLTPTDIYSIIMEGNEKMRPNTISEMNINISKYHKFWSKVIGYTSPSHSKFINVNWRFYKSYQVHEMVGNIVHEWLHLLGFLHGKKNIHEEVPYVVGKIAGDIAKKLTLKRDLASK